MLKAVLWIVQSSGIWRRVDWCTGTKILNELEISWRSRLHASPKFFFYLCDRPHGDISQKIERKLRGAVSLRTSASFKRGWEDVLRLPNMAFAIYFMIAQSTIIKELLIFVVCTLKYFTHIVLNFCRQSKVNSKLEWEQTITKYDL